MGMIGASFVKIVLVPGSWHKNLKTFGISWVMSESVYVNELTGGLASLYSCEMGAGCQNDQGMIGGEESQLKIDLIIDHASTMKVP